LLSELLQKAATEDASEQARLKEYEIGKIFEALDTRADL
jgi:hypothetical protein